MPNIFISYRRDDSPASARLIQERLREWFGEGHSFMDVEQIELGDNWKHVLDQRVSRCDALLTVIGPRWHWAEVRDAQRRLDERFRPSASASVNRPGFPGGSVT